MIIDAHTCWHTYEMKGIRFSPEKYIAVLDRCGIDSAMACAPFYLQSDFVLGNDRVLKMMEKYPSRVIGFSTIHPLFGPDALSEMDRCAGAGMKGVKLHCDLSQVSYDDVLTYPVAEHAVRVGLPLFLHTSERSLDAALHLAGKYPQAAFIFAHVGNTAWRRMCFLAEGMPNVTFCLSGQIFERGFLEEIVAAVGDERVVYGSDFVFLNPAINLGIVRNAALPEESKSKILGGNMTRMLHL